MSTVNLNLDEILGAEALTFGERATSFFKELSLGIDSFNAKNLNKSIHTLQGVEIWKTLGSQNNYFGVSIKHIPSPVFFNVEKMTFVEYVNLILRAVPILKLVGSQADNAYRSIKVCAATGNLPHTIRNLDNLVMINEIKEIVDGNIRDTGVYTRALSEMYPSFAIADVTARNFNEVVKTLHSRDAEVVTKQVNSVVDMAKILKRKIDSSDIILTPEDLNIMNDAMNELVTNVTFAGRMLSLLAELTRVMQLQIVEAKKL